MRAPRGVAAHVLPVITSLAMFPQCSSKTLYFASTTKTTSGVCKTQVMRLDDVDLSSNYQATVMLEYPCGPYNPGGGATGVCRLGDALYWGDQTTASVHSALFSAGKLTDHNTSFIGNLEDPQGMACGHGGVYVVDSIPGGGLYGVFFHSPKPGSPPTTTLSLLNMTAGGLRSVKIIDGSLWFGSDSGIFRTVREKHGSLTLTKVGMTEGKIYEDFEVVAVQGKTTRLFADTYDWGGDGVLVSELAPNHQNLTTPWSPLKGASCKRGSEMTWGLVSDPNVSVLYWVIEDDQAPNHMKIMKKNYDSEDSAQMIYSAVGSGYGLYFDAQPQHMSSVKAPIAV